MTSLATIAIEQIEVGQRLRDLSEAQVETLMSSIADVGLLNPITVYVCPVIRGGNFIDGYGLVAGAHRLEAFTRLGHFEIAAQIVELSELERQIAECDENLCSTSLTPSEKALFTRRRKQAYEALHPEAKAGVVRAKAANAAMGHDVDANFAPTFTADTAAKTGQSERLVQLNAERGMKISDKALATLRGTKLDTGSYLDKLKSIPAKDQVAHVKADLVAAKAEKNPVKKPAAPLNDIEARDQWLAAGMSWWNRGSKEWREEFLARIDTPVMDRSAA